MGFTPRPVWGLIVLRAVFHLLPFLLILPTTVRTAKDVVK